MSPVEQLVEPPPPLILEQEDMVITQKEHNADDVSLLDYEQQHTEPEVPAVLDDEDIMRLLVELLEVALGLVRY